jgi:hypothetical protein
VVVVAEGGIGEVVDEGVGGPGEPVFEEGEGAGGGPEGFVGVPGFEFFGEDRVEVAAHPLAGVFGGVGFGDQVHVGVLEEVSQDAGERRVDLLEPVEEGLAGEDVDGGPVDGFHG